MAKSARPKSKAPLPAFAGQFAKKYPDLWKTYSELGEQLSTKGPLNDRERRLVKLALAIASGSEGGTHSHARQALADGLTADDVRHVCLLGITTIGFPASAAALSWVDDVLPK